MIFSIIPPLNYLFSGFRRIGYTVTSSLAKYTPSALAADGAAPEPAVYVYDTFTDGDGTSLDAHTPDIDTEGGGWTEDIGTDWTITSNIAWTPDRDTLATAYIDAGQADVAIYVSAKNNASNAAARDSGVSARVTNYQNKWIIGFNKLAAAFKIVEVNYNIYTVRATTVVTVGTDEHDVKATCNDELITGWFDDANEISYAGAAFNKTNTDHGICVFGNSATEAYADEFKVTAL